MCQYMETCKVKEHLWLKWNPCELGKILQLVASYVLKPNELKTFMKVFWKFHQIIMMCLKNILWIRNLTLWKTMIGMY